MHCWQAKVQCYIQCNETFYDMIKRRDVLPLGMLNVLVESAGLPVVHTLVFWVRTCEAPAAESWRSTALSSADAAGDLSPDPRRVCVWEREVECERGGHLLLSTRQAVLFRRECTGLHRLNSTLSLSGLPLVADWPTHLRKGMKLSLQISLTSAGAKWEIARKR